ncbi:MAG: T9SS type A sorting domain-containing protein [Bacteroidota bacterium]
MKAMKIPFVCIFFTLSIFYLKAQTVFGPGQIVAQSDLEQPKHTSASDLDGDGDLDVLAVSEGDDELVWYQNLGNNSFSGAKIISTGDFNRALQVEGVDLDGDGDQDIVVSSLNTFKKISWYENLGNAQFGEQVVIVERSFPSIYTFMIDFDDDGDVDILSSFGWEPRISWHENNGQGVFTTEHIIDSTDLPIAPYIYPVDLDGDNDLDVLSVSNDSLSWYENTGDEIFADPQFLPTWVVSESIITAGDIDGDGDADILAADQFFGVIRWYENLGNGSFDDPQTIEADLVVVERLYIDDLDLDGDMDILAGAYRADNKIVWYENESNSQFAEAKEIENRTSGNLFHMQPIDLDGDGDSDILSSGNYDDVVGWIENKGEGEFSEMNSISYSYANAEDVMAVDIDGDGRLDILSCATAIDKVSWFQNLGDGRFSSERLVTDSLNAPTALFATDLDGDNDMDVIASSGDPKVVWYENDGSGVFGEEQVLPNGENITLSVYAADLDGDGDEDIISSLFWDDQLIWYENDGTGGFSSEKLIFDGVDALRDIYAADMDGDGDIDILTASSVDDLIRWYENDGNANFEAKTVNTSLRDPQTVLAADLDEDGDLDILSASVNSRDIAWFENSGDGRFASKKRISDEVRAVYAIHAADVDNDGDQDVLAGSVSDGIIALHRNKGLGKFEEVRDTIATDVWFLMSLDMADLDKDGDLDLLSASRTDDKITWFENLLGNVTLHGFYFLDENENGQFETDELKLHNQTVAATPEAIRTWVHSNGDISMKVDSGQYALAALQDTLWNLTTDSILNLVVDNTQDTIDFSFGLSPNGESAKASLDQSTAPTRCGFTVSAWINPTNTGNINLDGWLSYEPDSLMGFIDAIPAVDSTDGRTVFWKLPAIRPTETYRVRVNLQMPGVDFLGETLRSTASIYQDTDGGFELLDEHILASLIRCAYDPNDKRILPDTLEEDIKTLVGAPIEYMIRFQNTGTDTAFNVRITDQLSPDLDWTSFEILSASHAYDFSLDDKGEVSFFFNDIHLPDSNINEPASHGYIKFRIAPLEGTRVGTQIENTAFIYFDFNPPIITNTIVTTIFDPLLSTNDPRESANRLVKYLQVYPNPTDRQIQVELSLFEAKAVRLSLWNTLGVQLWQGHFGRQKQLMERIELDQLPSGIYFLQFQLGTEMVVRRIIKR